MTVSKRNPSKTTIVMLFDSEHENLKRRRTENHESESKAVLSAVESVYSGSASPSDSDLVVEVGSNGAKELVTFDGLIIHGLDDWLVATYVGLTSPVLQHREPGRFECFSVLDLILGDERGDERTNTRTD